MTKLTSSIKEIGTLINAKYDEKGNCIYSEYFGCPGWVKSKYDENNNCIYNEYQDGRFDKFEYDERGNCIHELFADGGWVKYRYDDNNNRIYELYSDGVFVHITHKYGEVIRRSSEYDENDE